MKFVRRKNSNVEYSITYRQPNGDMILYKKSGKSTPRTVKREIFQKDWEVVK